MKVIVIGAGMSGIIAGSFFPRKIQNLDLVIYDKNPDLGGTWFEQKYPGVACDVPSHAYQFTFENNPGWSSHWAGGAEIQGYLQNVANKYGANKYMIFSHKCTKAEWNEAEGKCYTMLIARDQDLVDVADYFITAVGPLNAWTWPDIPGLHTFKGKLMHTANYDSNASVDDQNVALIGGGSSGIQLLPQIQPKAKRVDHYMKGKTWIPPFGLGAQVVLERGGDPKTPPEDLKRFRDNPQEYPTYRRRIEASLHMASDVIYKDTPGANMFRKMCEDHMSSKLAKKPEIYEALHPTFAPACRRLTPGPGYLEALVQDNVVFIPNGIKEVDQDGILGLDGTYRPVDTIICATGFAGYKWHFPVIGKGKANLEDQWSNDIPEAYLAVAPENMPNCFHFLGPNGGPGIGSTVPFLELQAQYMIKCIQKVQREWIKSMTIRREAVKAFGQYCDDFLAPTVFNSSCRCWWRHKGNGRLLAIWPGSALHGMYAFENPRWEDFSYELKPELGTSPFNWFGNGYTRNQIGELNLGTTAYLDNPYITADEPTADEKQRELALRTYS